MYNCKVRGKCHQMDQVMEQVCCYCCVTDLEAFEIIALDISILSFAILNRCEITADNPVYTPRSTVRLPTDN